MLSFKRVFMDKVQGNIHEIQQQCPTWAMFDGALKLMYAIKDSSKVTQRGFQD
jgi:hypothetical protein